MEQFRESDISSELHRLYTFLHWPSDATVSPIRLARHGFQYDGPPGTTTRCAACHLVVDGWRKGDNPAEIHRQRSPVCPFMSAASCDRDVVHTSAMQFPSAAPAQSRGNDRPDVSARWHPCSTQTSSQSLQQANNRSAVLTTVPLCLVDGNTERQKAISNQVRVVDSVTTESRDINRPAPARTVGSPVNSGQATTTTNTNTSNNTARNETALDVASATNNATCVGLLSTGDSESTLLKENKQLKYARTCKVCMDADVDIVFLPCGHLVCCSNCSPSLRNCAICRSLIRGTVKIFLSD